MSFAHGSNDGAQMCFVTNLLVLTCRSVANAIGPLATIYLIWQQGAQTGATSPVPVWILAFGGVGIVIGLATYGYKMMSVLGNRITLHSPSRGFSME